MLIEALAAGVVGAALLWLVMQPMISRHGIQPVDTDPLDPEETPRGQALLALKEIEFDRATGKLSDADFEMLNARYSTAAIATLDAASDTPAAAVRCLVHGVRPESDAQFCSQCGSRLTAQG